MSNILIKNKEQIDSIRNICKQTASIFKDIDAVIEVGVTTATIDNLVCDKLKQMNLKSAALNYKGYPKSICTSINHQVCHGIPSDRKLKEGDIVNIDICSHNGKYYADTSKMYTISKTKKLASRLVSLCQEALYLGIEQVKPGNVIASVGENIHQFAKKHKLGIVREFCGHGVGLALHEEPQILHYSSDLYQDSIFEAGMIFTIEPMLNSGKKDISMLSDGWTAVTKDKSLSAQWEHTILVTETGYEILTFRDWEETIAVRT